MASFFFRFNELKIQFAWTNKNQEQLAKNIKNTGKWDKQKCVIDDNNKLKKQ